MTTQHEAQLRPRVLPEEEPPGTEGASVAGTTRSVLRNAGSLYGSTIITSACGFAFWVLAAHEFTITQIGIGAALLSALQLLAAVSTLGVGSLLIGELGRARGVVPSLVVTATVLVAGTGTLAALAGVTALHVASGQLAAALDRPIAIAVFTFGVAVTAASLVLDDACVGVLRAERQLLRNTLFSVIKLALLPIAAWAALGDDVFVVVWSLAVLASLWPVGFLVTGPRTGPLFAPALVRRHGGTALLHHVINFAIESSRFVLPLVATIVLGAQESAKFYTALLLVTFILMIPAHFSTVLFALQAGEEDALRRQVGVTLGVSLVVGVVSVPLVALLSPWVLGLFSPAFVDAAPCLVVLSLATVPWAFKTHYVAVCRVRGRLRRAAVVSSGGALLEVALAALGGYWWGVTGIAIGFVAAVSVQALVFWPTVGPLFRSALAELLGRWREARSGGERARVEEPGAAAHESITTLLPERGAPFPTLPDRLEDLPPNPDPVFFDELLSSELRNAPSTSAKHSRARSPDYDPRHARSTTGAAARRGLLPALCLVLGACLVIVSFSAGRTGQPWATGAYWAGQIIAFASVALPVFRRRASPRAVQGLVLAYAAAQSLFVYAYSPVLFRFPDELQHWRTAYSIQVSGHLFAPNHALPVSPRFPGLEVATMYGVKAFGLSLYESGRIVAFLAHLLLAAMVLVLTTRMLRSRRAAALATLFVLISPSNLVFNALFVYGGLAIPFLWLAVNEALAPLGRGVRRPAALACAALAVCTVTHHLTMVLGIAVMWALVGYGALRRPDRTLLVRWIVIAAVTTSCATLWVLWRAPEALGYLSAPFHDLFNRFTPGPKPTPFAPDPPPLPDRLLSVTAVALSAVLVPMGVVIFLRRRRDRISRLFLVAALLLYPTFALRGMPGVGAELSTRVLAYTAVFAAPAMVVALTAWYRWSRRPAIVSSTSLRSARVLLRICAPVAAVVLFAGNAASGWPPFWERVPGRNYVDGYESGITGSSLLLASWAAANLHPGDRVGCDYTACSVLSAFAGIDPVDNPARAVFAPQFDPAVIDDARAKWYGYLVIDRRIGTERTPTGTYYRHATNQDASKGPVPARSLQKFETAGSIQKIYDDGTYVVYDLRGLLR